MCSGDDYKNHVKCVSEEEKYSAKGWTPRANQNKNERKQTEWVEMVQGLANTVKADPALTRVLQTISLHENIPRKKPKFMVYSLKCPITYSMLITPFYSLSSFWQNFLKNIFGNRGNPRVAEQAWDLISKALEELRVKNSAQEQNNKNNKQEVKEEDKDQGVKRKNEENDEIATNGNSKKRKDDLNESGTESMTSENPQSNGNSGKVKWTTLAKTILRAQEDKELSLKKFQKKIIAEYLNRLGDPGDGSVEVLWAKCLKKLSKNPKFKIHKERIKILS